MGYALCLKKSAATETIRRPQRLYFLQTGETNDSFSWNLKQSGTQVAEGWKENEFGQFGRRRDYSGEGRNQTDSSSFFS
jgi:hypothetical protein